MIVHFEYKVVDVRDIKWMEEDGWTLVGQEKVRGDNHFVPIPQDGKVLFKLGRNG